MSDSAVTVTTIVPAYNAERYLAEALESLREQTYQDFEVVIVDDGSTDGTVEVANAFLDERTRLIRKENGGCASARNAGLKEARGHYISFLDADDYWSADKLAKEVAFLEHHPEICLVFSLSTIVDQAGISSGLLKNHRAARYEFADLVLENPIGNGSCFLMRRAVFERVGQFNESLPASSDCEMWFRLAHVYPSGIACLSSALTFYRRHDEQTTADWRRMASAYDQVIAKARQLAPELVTPLEVQARAKKYRYFAVIAYEKRDARAALNLLASSFRLGAKHFLVDPRAWTLLGATLMQLILPERIATALDRALRGFRRRILSPSHPEKGQKFRR